MQITSFLLLGLLVSSMAQAEVTRSDLKIIKGLKFPNSADEGQLPVEVAVASLRSPHQATGFTELLPFVLPSPDQEDAGSCLYMSLTGNAEWWLARLHPNADRSPDGPIDLSERHLMVEAGLREEDNGVENWKTDSAYLFNRMPGLALNRNFRFTKGWYVTDEEDEYQPANSKSPGAEYGPSYNWISELPKSSHRVALPKFRREVIFADPESDQWNTGVMPENIAERIKAALLKNKAPVHVLYNHYGYWHANLIVGFDDARDNENCSFVTGYIEFTAKKAARLKEKLKTTPPKDREEATEEYEKAKEAERRIKAAFAKGGGCRPKGVFYVRDSIYPDPTGTPYDYDPSQKGDESHYSKTTVLLEYDWVRYMGNHAVQILVD